MTVLTERRHDGGYVVAEFDMSYNRDKGVLASGQGFVEAGQILRLSGGKLYAQDVSIGTDGTWVHDCIGILYGGKDTTAGDTNCVFHARGPLTVNLAELIYPNDTTVGGEHDAAVAGLKLLGIIAR